MKSRIYFLDNLRTSLIFLVIVLHSGMVYEQGFDAFWIVSDPSKCDSLAFVRMYIDIFVMSVIFFISGYFVPSSLESKTSWDFVKSKFKRIFFPWIVAVFTLIPAYKAIFLYSRGLPQEEWFSYFHMFQRAGTDLSFFANSPNQSWLWFLPVLFLFQLLYMVLNRTKLLSLKISIKTAVSLIFVLGLAYSMFISNIGLTGWVLTPLIDFQRERLLVYFMVFLLGSLCFKLQVFESDKKNKKLFILSNVALTLSITVYTIMALNLFYNSIYPGRNNFFISETIDRTIYYASFLLVMLSFLHIFIHTFRLYFNKRNRLLDNLNQNTYYVYIIHLVVLGVIALLLTKVTIHPVIKFIVLSLLTFGVSHAIVFGIRKMMPGPTPKSVVWVIIGLAVITSIYVFGKNENYTLNASRSSTVIPGINLHEAAINGDIEAVREYIATGANVDVKDPASGSSPLITAIVFDKTEVALALIDAGANLDFQDNDDSTPLHAAAFFCRPEMVRILLDHGADRNMKNGYQDTPLESVSVPFDDVKEMYEYFETTLGPLGLKLDLEYIEQTRPKIAAMLR